MCRHGGAVADFEEEEGEEGETVKVHLLHVSMRNVSENTSPHDSIVEHFPKSSFFASDSGIQTGDTPVQVTTVARTQPDKLRTVILVNLQPIRRKPECYDEAMDATTGVLNLNERTRRGNAIRCFDRREYPATALAAMKYREGEHLFRSDAAHCTNEMNGGNSRDNKI